MMKLKDLITEITESTFRVTFDIEDAKLGRYTTDVEAKDKKEAEKIVAAKFVGGAKLITKGKTKKIKEGMNEGQKKRASDILRKFDMAYIKFSQEVRDVMKLMDKSTGNKTDSRIINKAYGKHLIPFDDIMQSWARGQQNNPKIDESVNEKRGTCWVGYKQVGMKDKGGRKVPNCVKEIYEIFYEEAGKGHGYTFEYINDGKLTEAEYQGRKVKLGKPMAGDAKKFKVYVKNPKDNVVKVNFGQGGKAKGGTMRIRKSNPKARKSFRARHNCDNPGPRHKARYWSCRKW